MSTVTDADTLRKLADWFDARDAVHGVSSSEVQRDLRRIADILDHNEDVKYLCDLQAENGEFRHMLDILNDALLEERLSNVGKVHPCDDQTAGHLASVEADNAALYVELAEAKQGIFKPDHPTVEERRLTDEIAKMSDELEGRSIRWLCSWHKDVSKALDLPDAGRYRNDAIERIASLRARIAALEEALKSTARLGGKRIAELEAELEEERHPTKYHDIDDLYPSDECPHGSLRRSCEICERDEEITRLRARIAELEAELGQLKRTVEFSEQEYLKEHGHWGSCPWKAKALELEARQPTEEQIDAAWGDPVELHHGDERYIKASDLGIVACEKCGGSGEVPTPETYAIETDGWDEACRDCKGHGWIFKPTNKEE